MPRKTSRNAPRSGAVTRWMRAILCLAVAGPAWSLTDAGTLEMPVKQCKTSFIDRVTFSVDRTGVIAKVPKAGDRIQAGEAVIQLKDEVPKAALAAAAAKAENDAEIRVAQKTVESAKLEYEAVLEANRKGAGGLDAYPPTHLARRKLEMEAAELKVLQAQQEQRVNQLARDQAQAELNTFRIISDISGLVTEVFKHRGEGVQQGEAIVQVVNTDTLRVEGYVSVEQSFHIKTGMPVKVTFDLPASASNATEHRSATGKLDFIDVTASELSDRVRVWAEIDNRHAQLREGLPVTMVILTDTSATDAPATPPKAN